MTNGEAFTRAITLHRPLDSLSLAGNSFTWRGRLDDPTSSVSAPIVDTNGVTNTVAGWVERAGLFWVEALPLSGGTNLLTLTATDAAGNSNATNIAVVQSHLALTIDDFSGADLTLGAIDLTSTIGSPDYAVWINGLRGANNGDGTWSAQGVPLNCGGAPTNENMRNPYSALAVATETLADQPFRSPYVQTYTNLRPH